MAVSASDLKLPVIQREWSDLLGIEHEDSQQFSLSMSFYAADGPAAIVVDDF